MDIKSVLKFILDPKLLAAGGAYAGYRFLGKGKPGATPYLYGAGGLAGGYLIGYLAQKYLLSTPAPALAAGAARAGLQDLDGLDLGEYVDLDLEQPLGLLPTSAAQAPRPAPPATTRRTTPPPAAQRAAARKVDTRESGDARILDSMGIFEDVGDGLGSYGGGLDGDVDVTEALKDHGWKRN